ncbi:transporter substrate-binding domain-containing protein [bacterium]|nr:transporter substrate-binding domain-containing protein [bacterium]
MLKKIICCLIFLIFLTTGCGKKQTEPEIISDLDVIRDRNELIVGVREDTKPFGYRDKDGNLQGIDIELAKEIAQYILDDKNKVKFVTVNAGNRIEKLNSKEVDILVATMTITSQRLRVVDFSQAYYVAGQALMVRAKSDITSLNQAVLYGPMIVVFGTTAEKALRDTYPAAKIIGAKTYQEAYEMLKSGKGDGIVADDTILMGFTGDKSVKLLPKRYSAEPYGVAMRQDASSDDLKIAIDELIGNMATDGKLKKLYK